MSRPAAFQFLNINCGLGAEEGSIVVLCNVQCMMIVRLLGFVSYLKLHMLSVSFSGFKRSCASQTICPRFGLYSAFLGIPFSLG